MGKVDMNVSKETMDNFHERGKTQRIKTSFPVTLILASYQRGNKDHGRLTIRLDNASDVDELRRINKVPPGSDLCYAVRYTSSGLIHVAQHAQGYTLSGSEIQVTTLARMNVKEPPPEHFQQVPAIMSWGPGNCWDINVPKGFLDYWDFNGDGTRMRSSQGRKKGSENKDRAARRGGDAAPKSPPAPEPAPTGGVPKMNATAQTVFPIPLPATDRYYVVSDQLVRDVWLRVRPRDLSWHALDGTLHADRLVIEARDLLDDARGGIGKVIHTVEVREFTEAERVAIKERVLRAMTAAAEQAYKKEMEAEHRRRVLAIRKEIFGV